MVFQSLHSTSITCGNGQVNLKLFTPEPKKRKTVLLFVLRDMTKTPLKQLKTTWEEDLHRMWASITKPPDYDSYSFSDFFEVSSELLALPCVPAVAIAFHTVHCVITGLAMSARPWLALVSFLDVVSQTAVQLTPDL